MRKEAKVRLRESTSAPQIESHTNFFSIFGCHTQNAQRGVRAIAAGGVQVSFPGASVRCDGHRGRRAHRQRRVSRWAARR